MKTSFHYFYKLCLFHLLIIIPALLAGCGKTTDSNSGIGPIEPENALSTFELEPGFKIELVANEPLVSDPVDMEIDEYGRLYVVEMHGYPLDKSGAGQIKLLTDTNGDGRMDKSTVFADGLTLPFGIMRWKKGVLVTDAPHVLYLEDTTGDGKADIRDTVLTGFAFSNAQMNVGNPLYGLDNWIYLTSESGGTYQIYKKEFGDLGGDIFFPGQPGTPHLPLDGTGRTVRFRPDQHELELTSGMTQFGHAFDDWGHHLLGNNSDHIYHEVIAAPYLKRNPDLLVSNATQTLTDHGSEVFPITRNPERQLLTSVGVFTSACGNTAYSGGAFPAPYNDNVYFVAEPVSNIVHADHLTDEGASFIASRVGRPHTEEFLASTDAWFRPVNMYIGPDGALYVVDYYRQIIEHPEWMSEEAIEAGGLYNGNDRGRIYRITPTEAEPAVWTKGLQLGDATNEALVEELANPNRWWRMNAQRLLVDRASKQVIPALVQMAKNTASPMGRLHALWTLEGMGELKPELIELALKDTVAGIRENVVKLAELHLSTAPDLVKALLALQEDPDAKVRFQLLCTLGFIDTPQSAQARHKLLFRDLDDNWAQIAALSASSSQTASLLKVVLDNFKQEVPAYASLVQRLTTMVGASGEPGNIGQLIQKAALAGSEKQSGWQAPVLEGLAQGLERRKLPSSILQNEQDLLIRTFFEHPSTQVRKASLQMLKVTGIHNKSQAKEAIEKAVSIAEDRSLSDEKRAEAINFLALDNPAPHVSLLKKLIIPQEQPSVQFAALNTLSLIPDQTVTQYVLQQWPALTPEIRDAAINTFLSAPDRVSSLLDAIDSGKIQKASVNFYQGVRLMTQPDEKLRKRARSMFAHNEEEKVNKEYQQALRLKGDEVKGKAVYAQNCAICHQVRGAMGVSFGPDLGTVHNWQPEGIMAHILAPNLSIASGYELWAVELNNGESVQGIISSETPAAITLKNAGSVEKTINRQDITSLKTLNISAMPAGLEKNINQQQMADILAFLRQNK
jgi:putative membrane-bound dehydrogenase-like protein